MEDIRNYASIGEQKVLVARLKLRDWLRLEGIHADIFDAVEAKDGEHLVSLLYSYVSTASSIPIPMLMERPWYEIARAYVAFYAANIPHFDFPFLRRRKKEASVVQTEEGWEYEGRSWYMWAHMLAHAYGWSLQHIAEMDVDDALALLQEIEVEEQLQREWEWGLSEKSVSYDQYSKTSHFVPLHRPEWMNPASKVKEIPKSKIKRSDLPVGLVVRWDDGKSNQPQ